MDWIGRYAQVKAAGTPGWGPEGLVSYPEGIGGFIVGADGDGRPLVRLSHFFGRSNRSLEAYGEVAFEVEDLFIGDGVQSWGEDDRSSR